MFWSLNYPVASLFYVPFFVLRNKEKGVQGVARNPVVRVVVLLKQGTKFNSKLL